MEDDQSKTLDAMSDEPKSITERSTLTISLVVALIGGLISFTWWARGLQADVRTMQVDVAGIKQSVQNLSKVDQVSQELRELKQYGSDVSRKVALDLIELKRDFELHKVQTSK